MKPLYILSKTIVFRLPILSLQDIIELFESAKKQPLDACLRTFFAKPYLDEALYLASPSLHAHFRQFGEDTRSALPASIASALFKYAIRSGSRSTPFGFFAGLAVGEVHNKSEFQFETARLQSFTRLDSNATVQLYERLMSHASIRSQLRYRVNDSSYLVGNEIRYSEFIDLDNVRQVQLSSLLVDGLLEMIGELTQIPRSFTYLLNWIQSSAKATMEESLEYLNGLIDSKFLLSELEPTVTGKAYLQTLQTFPFSDNLPEIAFLARLPQNLTISQTITPVLQQTDEDLRSFGLQSDNQQSFWQTDLFYRTTKATVKQTILQQIGQQVQEAASLLEAKPPTWIPLFKKRFTDRYGDQVRPLLEVLDNEFGIGLQDTNDYVAKPAPLLTTLFSTLQSSNRSVSNDTKGVDLKSRLYRKAQLTGQKEIHVTSADLQPPTAFPLNPAIWGSLLSGSAEQIDQNQYQFLLFSVLKNTTSLLGRFCQNSPELTGFAREIHEQEAQQNPGVIYAEIVHLAGARSGNVNVRPELRTYEIPYLTPPAVDDEFVIGLADLLVTVVGGREIKLYSKKLQKQVIPRLSTAHNAEQGDEVYRFLTGLFFQETAGGRWDWSHLTNEPFLPRICYKQLILSRAQWTFTVGDIAQFPTAEMAWLHFKERFSVPRYLLIQTGDNELLLDTQLDKCESLLLEEVKKNQRVKLVEWVNSPDRSWIQNNKGQTYSHEILLYLHPARVELTQPVNDKPELFPSLPADLMQERFVTRTFLPGSEWIYVKLYVGHDSSERVLLDALVPLMNKLIATGHITKWFYIRYYDPEFHIRFRVQLASTSHYARVMRPLNKRMKALQTEQKIYKIQVDTYERELERYGFNTIENCETYFYIDSITICSFLTQFPYATEQQRVVFALHNAVNLVNDFHLSLTDSLALFRQLQQSYFVEFGSHKALRDQLNKLYREWSPVMERLFSPEMPADSEESAYLRILAERSARTKPVIELLHQELQPGNTPTQVQLISSLLHMSFNRQFTSQFRLYELLIYHLICRYYESKVARLASTNHD